MSWILLTLLLLPVALFVAFLLFTFLLQVPIAVIEKQQIRSLEPIPADQMPELSPYVQAMNSMAERLGFHNCGIYGRRKKDAIPIYACLWLDENMEIIGIVADGRVLTRVQQTGLFSYSADGHLGTMDIIEPPSMSGLVEMGHCLNGDFAELYDLHRKRVEDSGKVFRKFAPERLLDELADVDAELVTRLEEIGYASFIDASRSTWRFTLKGALLMYFKNHIYSFRMSRAYSDRLNRPRPGDAGYVPGGLE